MTPERCLDRIDQVLHEYVSGAYDEKPDDEPLCDIAELVDHYNNTKDNR